MQTVQKIANLFSRQNIHPDRNELIANFCDDWAKCADRQSLGEYEEYYQIYEEILDTEDETSIAFTTDYVIHVCSIFLSSASQILKQRGLELVFKFYEKILINKKLKKKSQLFIELFRYVCNAIESIDIESLKKINWTKFLNDYLQFDIDKFEENKIRGFYRHLGYRIAEDKKEDIDNIINDFIQFSSTFWGEKGSLCRQVIYDFFFGFVEFERIGILNVVLKFNDGYFIPDNLKIILLQFFCYFYYYVYREDDRYISIELKEKIKKWCIQSEVCKSFDHLLHYTIDKAESNNSDCKFADIKGALNELSFYEKSYIGCVKQIIMPSVARDFLTFSFLYVCRGRYAANDILDHFISEKDVDSYYIHYVRDSNKELAELIRGYLSLLPLSDKKVDIENSNVTVDINSIDACVNQMQGLLDEYLRKRYKKWILNRVKEKVQHPIDNNVNNISEKEKSILDYLRDSFNKIISEDVYQNGINGDCIFKFSYLVDFGVDKFIERLNSSIGDHLIYYIYNNFLFPSGKVNRKVRSEFADDDHYLQYLKQGEFKELIGSDIVLRPQHWENRNKYEEILTQKVYIERSALQISLLLKANALRIFIRGVKITIREQTLNEISYNKDGNGNYVYETTKDIFVPFSENELIEYLQVTRRMFVVTINMTVKVDDSDYIGDVIFFR